ncbi:DUF1972 domain-containing protein [Tannerella sp.]|uniref:DUF1972 domain-containing protein n=1 Tax=Tannerella sp. TaxID=2382127 RepID=UPI0026DACA1C|nr:DUF1972 domain-containing protein [Tannerella sp.]MDO4702716.1 DUF1972 domain-containing protein [Tannerella sp.]
MKIAILGTRGIPNNYGGFEQFAEYLSVGLVEKGHEVTVYSPHFHDYKESVYKGVRIKHLYSPEHVIGSSFGSFFYDYVCLKDVLKGKDKFDILYELGYTSVVPSYIWFNVKKIKSPILITNMDGLEYLRPKFNRWVRCFLRWEEKMAVRYSPHIVTDNKAIHNYHLAKYGKESKFLAYGACVHTKPREEFLHEFNLTAGNYFLVIARMEPENNIEMVIKGYLDSEMRNKPLIIVGRIKTSHGKYLFNKYRQTEGIRFVNGIYDFEKLCALRRFSYVYFHGHSVGGTNPSLLEAMASRCLIAAHDNAFNRSTLEENALFFHHERDVTRILNGMSTLNPATKGTIIANNFQVAQNGYSWEKLVNDYEAYFLQLLSENGL